ncbi:MAG: substrate-binding domain-containing protein [Verrucomicrobiota bacterium]
MPDLPQRRFLAHQVADMLRDGIRRGLWQSHLPAERALCAKYQVSRVTVRSALKQLQREKLIRSEHGSGSLILAKPRKQAGQRQSHDVGLLSPEPLERLRPAQTLWIDELRAMLSEHGCRLHVFHGRQFFRGNPSRSLRRLIAENPHGCWILTLSNAAIQQWFDKQKVPCIVAGSVHAGLGLPFRDLDHRAMCRHAAGVLLGLGHRRLALVIATSDLAGDIESEAGFVEGVERSSHIGAQAGVARHDGTLAGISLALRRLMEKQPPTTGLVVANALNYLTVVSRLAQMGRRVPQDVSVISRDDDIFLSYLVPAPARYETSPHILARSLLRPVLELLARTVLTRRDQRLMPDFVRGESVSPIT